MLSGKRLLKHAPTFVRLLLPGKNFLYTEPEATVYEQNMLLPVMLYKNYWSIIFSLSILRANYIPLSFKFLLSGYINF